MRLLLILVLVVIDMAVLPGLRLHCPDKAVEAVSGQNVTLLCSTDPPVKPDIAEWLVNDTHCDVYLFLGGKVDLDHQCEEYRGKASHFLDELSSGNSSLRLTTQPSHSGRYRCSVRVGDWIQNCFINLTVLQRGEHDTVQDNTTENPPAAPPGNSNDTAVIIGVVVLILVLVLVLLLLVVVVYLHRNRNHRQRQQNPVQNNERVDVQHRDRDPAEEPMNPSGNRDEIEMRNMGTPADDNV